MDGGPATTGGRQGATVAPIAQGSAIGVRGGWPAYQGSRAAVISGSTRPSNELWRRISPSRDSTVTMLE